MKTSIKNLRTEISAIISRLNCDYAEARISSGRSTVIVLSGDEIDMLSSGESIGGSIRVLNKGQWGFVSFNDLTDIEGFAKRGIEISSKIKSSVKTKIAGSKPLKKSFITPVNIDFTEIPLEEKLNQLNTYNGILKSSKYIQTTRATYRDVRTEYLYINSEGADILYDKSSCGVALSSVAKDGSIIQPFGDSSSGNGGYEKAQGHEETAERVVRIAVDLLKAESVEGGSYDVIIDQKLAGVFIHEAFGHLSEADFICENESMKKLMVLGKRFGPDGFNVIDDGALPGLPGCIPFDDEGVLPSRTFLIENGILNGRLHSRETACRMDEELTGNARAMSAMSEPIVRMTNTFVENGTIGKEEIFDSVNNGIYAVDCIGGQTNLEMFTFSAGYGYKIRNGKIGKMVKDVMLSGNVFSTLKNIKLLGNDKKMYGGLGGCGKKGQGPLPVSFGGPHILIGDVLIGGKQR